MILQTQFPGLAVWSGHQGGACISCLLRDCCTAAPKLGHGMSVMTKTQRNVWCKPKSRVRDHVPYVVIVSLQTEVVSSMLPFSARGRYYTDLSASVNEETSAGRTIRNVK